MIGPLSFAVFVPALAALAILLMPRGNRKNVFAMAVGTGAFLFLLSVYILVSYHQTPSGYLFEEQYDWMPSLGISFHLGVDGVGAILFLLTGIVTLAASLVGWTVAQPVAHDDGHGEGGHAAPAPRPLNEFYFFLFILVSGVYGMFASLDLFFLFFFYELAALPMYPLIAIWGSSTKFARYELTKEYGALKLVLYLLLGSVLVWIGLVAMWTQPGMGSFDLLALKEYTFSREFQLWVFPLFAIGFGVLATLWPFHTWSPDGHVAAPTPVSMLHAGVLTKLGAFGILRVGMEVLPQGAEFWMPWVAALAIVNIIYGAIVTTAQSDLKYIVGYSSVGHMGYILLGLATLQPLGMAGAVLQMFSHGVMAALFFTSVGILYDRSHRRDVALFEGLAKRMGVTTGFFTVVGLSSLALPGTSAFIAELLVILGCFAKAFEGGAFSLLWFTGGVAGIVGALLTAVYILRMLVKAFFGPLESTWGSITDASKREKLAAGLLAAAILTVGIFPFPFLTIVNGGLSSILPLFKGGG